MTAPDRDVARNIAKSLVTEKLAACVNVLGGEAESYYEWEGKFHEGKEVLMLAKTSVAEAMIKRIKELHPYDVPCTLILNVESDYKNSETSPFLKWIKESCVEPNASNQ